MHAQLRCPNCRQEFDYKFTPGISFTSVRLGKSCYMGCPLCGRWPVFDLPSAYPRD